MKPALLVLALFLLSACGRDNAPAEEPGDAATDDAAAMDDAPVMDDATAGCTPPDFDVGESVELAPGLTATLLERGYGRRAVAGDSVDVDYTGWLFDPEAEDSKGEKFDSSVDRNERFSFVLGAGRVIRGWDEGVACMLLGERRLLKIAPEMGYGERGIGSVIPPNATLLFDVKLYEARGPDE